MLFVYLSTRKFKRVKLYKILTKLLLLFNKRPCPKKIPCLLLKFDLYSNFSFNYFFLSFLEKIPIRNRYEIRQKFLKHSL